MEHAIFQRHRRRYFTNGSRIERPNVLHRRVGSRRAASQTDEMDLRKPQKERLVMFTHHRHHLEVTSM